MIIIHNDCTEKIQQEIFDRIKSWFDDAPIDAGLRIFNIISENNVLSGDFENESKDATLNIKLSCDSGYSVESKVRISPSQWGAINGIING